jgi:DNA-binding MarR family transcriptional regulator
MMNRQTTDAPGDGRTELARRATDALERVACTAGRELDRHAGGYGLSDAKLELLEVLCCRDESRACLHALGDELGVTRPNVTKLVDGLERGGLVERMPHPSDGRMVHAHLTAEGRELAGEALPGRLGVIERLWEALDDDELERLVALLDAVASRAPAAPAGAAGGTSR